jgi:hypothetical protein
MVKPTNGWGAVRADWAPRVLGMYWRIHPPLVGPQFNPGTWKGHIPGKWPQQAQGVALTRRSVTQPPPRKPGG